MRFFCAKFIFLILEMEVVHKMKELIFCLDMKKDIKGMLKKFSAW